MIYDIFFKEVKISPQHLAKYVVFLKQHIFRKTKKKIFCFDSKLLQALIRVPQDSEEKK